MIWRLFNKLFGWHYGVTTFAGGSVVVRIRKAPNGLLYIKLYGDTLLQNSHDGRNNFSSKRVVPLTFQWGDDDE